MTICSLTSESGDWRQKMWCDRQSSTLRHPKSKWCKTIPLPLLKCAHVSVTFIFFFPLYTILCTQKCLPTSSLSLHYWTLSLTCIWNVCYFCYSHVSGNPLGICILLWCLETSFCFSRRNLEGFSSFLSPLRLCWVQVEEGSTGGERW